MEKKYERLNIYPIDIKGPSKRLSREFPGGLVVRTPRFHCQGPGFDPWSGN